jgi:hypothetical protein
MRSIGLRSARRRTTADPCPEDRPEVAREASTALADVPRRKNFGEGDAGPRIPPPAAPPRPASPLPTSEARLAPPLSPPTIPVMPPSMPLLPVEAADLSPASGGQRVDAVALGVGMGGTAVIILVVVCILRRPSRPARGRWALRRHKPTKNLRHHRPSLMSWVSSRDEARPSEASWAWCNDESCNGNRQQPEQTLSDDHRDVIISRLGLTGNTQEGRV